MPNKDAKLNAAEINAEMEVGRLFFRPACEIKAAVKRIVTEAYVKGYDAAVAELNNRDIDNKTI